MTVPLSWIFRAPSRPARTLGIALLASAIGAPVVAQHSDVLLQTVDGKIATGSADYDSNTWTLGTQVYRRHFLSNYRSSDPGFTGFAYGNPNLPPGAGGFPSNHDVNFDLVPMTIGQTTSNLYFWDGSDLGGDGLDLSDVAFVVPSGISWDVYDENFDLYSATGTDQLVPGGLIQTTSADIDPLDGVDSGAIHNHLVLQLSANDGNTNTTPPEGVYMIAWQVWSVGFETSDPLVFVHRTPTVSNLVRDLAADWVTANLIALFPPALPGDYNGDGTVDASDYTVWRDSFGVAKSLPNEAATQNVVDDEDYVVWKTHFGESLAGGVGARSNIPVPEPTSPLLFGMFSAVLVVRAARPGHCGSPTDRWASTSHAISIADIA